jgi:hypothetical protein
MNVVFDFDLTLSFGHFLAPLGQKGVANQKENYHPANQLELF